MTWPVVVAGANAVLALALVAFALIAWYRGRDRRAAWMTLALASLLALSGVVLWQAWTSPLDLAWGLVAVTEGLALVSLYIGALR